MTDITPKEKLNKVILIELSLLKNINLHDQKRYNTAQKIWVICSRFAGPISFSSREGGGGGCCAVKHHTSHSPNRRHNKISQPNPDQHHSPDKCHNKISTNVTTSKKIIRGTFIIFCVSQKKS